MFKNPKKDKYIFYVNRKTTLNVTYISSESHYTFKIIYNLEVQVLGVLQKVKKTNKLKKVITKY